jgi:hypothetical protein
MSQHARRRAGTLDKRLALPSVLAYAVTGSGPSRAAPMQVLELGGVPEARQNTGRVP